VMVDQAKFRKMVRPGDQLSVSGTIVSINQRSAQMDGEIRITDNLVMNARLTFALDDADRFYPIKTRRLMETIYDVWLEDTLFKDDKGG
jgi:acyl-CoA thioesterase FadM